MKRWPLLVALALPIVGMVAWVARLEWGRQVGHEVTLKVVAYDPRDLLAGHYLQYAVEYGLDPCVAQPQVSHATCVCLETPSGDVSVAGWTGECGERPSNCQHFLSGRCEYGRFSAGIERYYIPEAHSQKLLQFPPNASIRLRLSGEGAAQVTAFLVDGAPLADFVARQR